MCPLVTSGSVVSPEGADGGHRGHPGGGRGLHHRVPGPRHPGPPPPVPAPGGRTAGHHLGQLGAVQLRRLEENILIFYKNVSFLLAVCWTQITNIYSFNYNMFSPWRITDDIYCIIHITLGLKNISIVPEPCGDCLQS